MEATPWWKQPLRVLQTNLQVADTPLMDPEKIALETEQMHANALVVNMGGIYAWYQSKVPFHHINEYLPTQFDLLERLIAACHRRNIRVIGRFDFSKAEDRVSQLHPEWFIRNPDGTRRAYGMERPGNWSILYMTCSNAGYRNDEVAVPVLKEAVSSYDIDGVFLNAPGYDYCTCPACREKYQRLYGKPLPIRTSDENGEETYGRMPPPPEMDPDFPGICYRDNISRMYQAIKSVRPEVPLILYYSCSAKENLQQRLETADMLCCEAQDVLSRKWSDIPPMWYPTLIMKYGRTQPNDGKNPFGIIHSCPGMDWRHTGLPPAEYASWLRQIPAAGGSIWHSVTGFADTITDKRILDTITALDADIATIETDMHGAREHSDVLLLWNGETSYGWVQLFVNTQTQFDLCTPGILSREKLAQYPVVVVPDEYPLTEASAAMLCEYARQGGKLVVEGTTDKQLLPFADLLGIDPFVYTSEELTACYWQFEPEGKCLQQQLEHTPILPHRGVTAYTRAKEGTRVLATLIPPFAPLNAVGAPPERASMLVKHTDIPLCTMNSCEKGVAVMLPFRLSALAYKHRLTDFYRVWNNLANMLLGGQRTLRMDMVQGIITNVYTKADTMLVHMVNAIGSRPLTNIIPYHDFDFEVSLPQGRSAASVEGVLQDADFRWEQAGSAVHIHVNRLRLWEMFRITLNP